MIKKQQKWIALAVALTFMWLLQVSAMPLPAAGTAVTAASDGLGTDHYEAVGQKPAPVKKKSILPWILIGAGVLTVTALVLFLFVLKGYDITGVWFVHIDYYDDDDIYIMPTTFSGDKKSGTTRESRWGGAGTYTVDGKNVSFTITWSNANRGTYTGTFTDKDTMSGTFTELGEWDGTWTATRNAAAIGNEPIAKEARSTQGGGK